MMNDDQMTAQEAEREPTGDALVRPELGDSAGFAQFVHECAGLAKVHADMLQQYIEIGDPVGMTYATRCLVTYTKAIGSSVKVMNETRKRRELADGQQ